MCYIHVPKLSFRNFNVGLFSNLKNHKRILYKLSIDALKRASCFNLKPTKCICKAARYKLVNRYIAYSVHLSFDLYENEWEFCVRKYECMCKVNYYCLTCGYLLFLK